MRRPDVTGFLHQPVPISSQDSLNRARIMQSRAAGTLVLPVGTTKGGAGKSMLTLNLAAAFGMPRCRDAAKLMASVDAPSDASSKFGYVGT